MFTGPFWGIRGVSHLRRSAKSIPKYNTIMSSELVNPNASYTSSNLAISPAAAPIPPQCSHKEKVSLSKALFWLVTYVFRSSINFNLNSFAFSMLIGNSSTSAKTLFFSSALSFPRALPLRENCRVISSLHHCAKLALCLLRREEEMLILGKEHYSREKLLEETHIFLLRRYIRSTNDPNSWIH